MTATSISGRRIANSVIAAVVIALAALMLGSPIATAGGGTVGFKSRVTLKFLPDEGTMLAHVRSKSKRCKRNRPVVLRRNGEFFASENTNANGFAGFSEMFSPGTYRAKVQRGVFHMPSGKTIRCSADRSPAFHLL